MEVSIQRLDDIADRIRSHHEHCTIAQLNHHIEVKLAINDRDYFWHRHHNSDELLIVIEGTLLVDLEDERIVTLRTHDAILIPAGTLHRTRPDGRAVNLVIEDIDTDTTMAEVFPSNAAGENANEQIEAYG